VVVASIPANGTNLLEGAVPCDAHAKLKGTIEAVSVRLTTGSAPQFAVAFFSKATADSVTHSVDAYIDHEAFVNTDFITMTASSSKYAGKSGLNIPYFDADASKKFHIGIVNKTTAIPAGKLVVQWAWRPDLGGR
jgi:hypothetical protein